MKVTNQQTRLQKCFFIYVGQPDMSFALAAKRDYNFKREPQIGFAYLCAVIREHGVDPTILDFTITPYTKNQLIKYIVKESPVFVGFYAAADLKDSVLNYMKALRHAFPGLKILIGGPDMFDCESYLHAGADAYCLGEGERTIIDLLAYCRGQMARSEIKGIAYKQDGQTHYNAHRELIENLDELPIPAWDKFDLNNYYDFHIFDMQRPYASIMASRGCPFRCSYCVSHEIWRHRQRFRSPRHVIEEIDYLVRQRGVKHIRFQDDVWGWDNEGWVRTICEELTYRKYDLRWRCIIHPMSFMKNREKILTMMHKAGCTSIATGLQSASEKILKNIHRSSEEPEALAELLNIMNRLGIINNTSLIFGLPGETEETIEESIRYVIKHKPSFCSFFILTAFPGSHIWQMQQEGKFHSLPQEVIKKRAGDAARRFYTNPGVVWNIYKLIMRTNPRWFLTAFRHLKYILEMSGVFSNKASSVDSYQRLDDA